MATAKDSPISLGIGFDSTEISLTRGSGAVSVVVKYIVPGEESLTGSYRIIQKGGDVIFDIPDVIEAMSSESLLWVPFYSFDISLPTSESYKGNETIVLEIESLGDCKIITGREKLTITVVSDKPEVPLIELQNTIKSISYDNTVDVDDIVTISAKYPSGNPITTPISVPFSAEEGLNTVQGIDFSIITPSPISIMDETPATLLFEPQSPLTLPFIISSIKVDLDGDLLGDTELLSASINVPFPSTEEEISQLLVDAINLGNIALSHGYTAELSGVNTLITATEGLGSTINTYTLEVTENSLGDWTWVDGGWIGGIDALPDPEITIRLLQKTDFWKAQKSFNLVFDFSLLEETTRHTGDRILVTLDNTEAYPTLSFSSVSYSVNNDAGSISITITPSKPFDQDIYFDILLFQDTNILPPAILGVDYLLPEKVLLLAGDPSVSISVPILQSPYYSPTDKIIFLQIVPEDSNILPTGDSELVIVETKSIPESGWSELGVTEIWEEGKEISLSLEIENVLEQSEYLEIFIIGPQDVIEFVDSNTVEFLKGQISKSIKIRIIKNPGPLEIEKIVSLLVQSRTNTLSGNDLFQIRLINPELTTAIAPGTEKIVHNAGVFLISPLLLDPISTGDYDLVITELDKNYNNEYTSITSPIVFFSGYSSITLIQNQSPWTYRNKRMYYLNYLAEIVDGSETIFSVERRNEYFPDHFQGKNRMFFKREIQKIYDISFPPVHVSNNILNEKVIDSTSPLQEIEIFFEFPLTQNSDFVIECSSDLFTGLAVDDVDFIPYYKTFSVAAGSRSFKIPTNLITQSQSRFSPRNVDYTLISYPSEIRPDWTDSGYFTISYDTPAAGIASSIEIDGEEILNTPYTWDGLDTLELYSNLSDIINSGNSGWKSDFNLNELILRPEFGSGIMQGQPFSNILTYDWGGTFTEGLFVPGSDIFNLKLYLY